MRRRSARATSSGMSGVSKAWVSNGWFFRRRTADAFRPLSVSAQFCARAEFASRSSARACCWRSTPAPSWSNADDVIVSLDGPREVHDRRAARVPRGIRKARARSSGDSSSAGGFPDLGSLHRAAVEFCAPSRNRPPPRASSAWRESRFSRSTSPSNAFNRTALSPPTAALTPEDLPGIESEIEAIVADGECGGFVMESPEKLRKDRQAFSRSPGFGHAGGPRLQRAVGFRFRRSRRGCAPLFLSPSDRQDRCQHHPGGSDQQCQGRRLPQAPGRGLEPHLPPLRVRAQLAYLNPTGAR